MSLHFAALDSAPVVQKPGPRMRILLRLALGAACAVPLLANAVTYTWTGLGTTNRWWDTGNWNPTGYPTASTDMAVFPAAPQSYTPLVANLSGVGTMRFDASGYTVSVPSLLYLSADGITGSYAAAFSLQNQGGILFVNSASAGASQIAVGPQAFLNFTDYSSLGNATIVAAGTMKMLGRSWGANATVNLAGGTLDLTGRIEPASIGSLFDSAAQPGTLKLDSVQLALGMLNTNDTIHGTISGVIPAPIEGEDPGSLVKVGTGTLTLKGNNTYPGRSTVVEGVLDIEGTQAGDIDVYTNGVLSGGGSVQMVKNRGTLRPGGNSSDHLTLSGLTCDAAAPGTVLFSLDTAHYLHFTGPLRFTSCFGLDITAQTSQPIVSGARYIVAALDSGTDFTESAVTVHLNQAITRVRIEANALVLQVYAPDDYVFADGFGD